MPVLLNTAPPQQAPSIDTMSLDDLAQAMRPLVLLNGQEYIGADPDYDMATKVKAHAFDGTKASPSTPPVAASSVILPGADAGTSSMIAKTTDQRYPVSPLYSPFHQNATIVTYHDGDFHYLDEGSATVIGPQTAMTAAHVVYDHTNEEWNTFAAGFAAPGDFEAEYYGYFNQDGCMATIVPYDYTFDTTEYWDWTVLDFTNCTGSNNPANSVGYTGYWVGFNSYPNPNDFLDINGSPDPAAHCNWPHGCGMSGQFDSVSEWEIISSSIFTGEGQSGVSWTLWDDYNNSYYFYHVATHVADLQDINGTFISALGRVFNSVPYAFCQTYSDPTRFP